MPRTADSARPAAKSPPLPHFVPGQNEFRTRGDGVWCPICYDIFLERERAGANASMKQHKHTENHGTIVAGEFHLQAPDNHVVVIVENGPATRGAVRIHATRPFRSPQHADAFVRMLAAEGFIPAAPCADEPAGDLWEPARVSVTWIYGSERVLSAGALARRARGLRWARALGVGALAAALAVGLQLWSLYQPFLGLDAELLHWGH